MVTLDKDLLPPDLQRWGWTLSQMTIGSGKDPGGWQFVFTRHQGLAQGDNDLTGNDASLSVEVRRATVEEALDAALRGMRDVSSRLTPIQDYDEQFAEFQREASGNAT